MYFSKVVLFWPECRNPYQWHRPGQSLWLWLDVSQEGVKMQGKMDKEYFVFVHEVAALIESARRGGRNP